MRRKPLLLAVGIAVVLVSVVVGTLALLARHEPEFYRQREVAPGDLRKKQSGEFLQTFSYVLSRLTDGDGFSATFTEEQINSYFQENFITSGFAKNLLPENISAPRVVVEPERIRLAFRYGSPPWCSVISIDWRVWLVPAEPNVVALELQGLHAGSLPISAQSLLEQISDIARRKNIDVTWFRHQGNPVALLRFQNEARSAVQLHQLDLGPGKLTLVGRAVDIFPRTAAGRPGLTAPTN
jgi:hypothetical protein